jgi:hypothetical protein
LKGQIHLCTNIVFYYFCAFDKAFYFARLIIFRRCISFWTKVCPYEILHKKLVPKIFLAEIFFIKLIRIQSHFHGSVLTAIIGSKQFRKKKCLYKYVEGHGFQLTFDSSVDNVCTYICIQEYCAHLPRCQFITFHSRVCPQFSD